MHKLSTPWVTALAFLATSGTAYAQEPAAAAPAEPAAAEPATASAEISLGGAKADAKGGKKKNRDSSDEPWIKRYRPTRNQMEAGIYGGVLLPNTDHEL